MSRGNGGGRPILVDPELVAAAVRDASRIDPDMVAILDLLRRVELRTNAYHRELVGTRPVDDPHVAAFLQRWAAEEMEHGHALSSVVAARGYPSTEVQLGIDAQACQAQHRRTMRQNRVISQLMPSSFLATHMTVGLMNEWTAHFIYRCLADMTGSVPLRQLLEALSRQESHHAGQYRRRAVEALEQNQTARVAVRMYLRNSWSPVGEDVLGVEAQGQIYNYLGQHPKWTHFLDVCDERIGKLPGLNGFTPWADVQTALEVDQYDR